MEGGSGESALCPEGWGTHGLSGCLAKGAGPAQEQPLSHRVVLGERTGRAPGGLRVSLLTTSLSLLSPPPLPSVL